jgi:hypothetical protein
MRTHLDEFLAFARERSGRPLPKYVRDEFTRYLACGDFSRGFVRVYCDECRLVRYAGVFAAGSAWRKHVVPAHPPERRCCAQHERERKEPAIATGPEPAEGSASPRAKYLDLAPSTNSTRIDWASLLRHGLDIDALACPRCGSRMRVLAAVTEPEQVRRVLAHLGKRDVPSRAWDPVPVDARRGWN